MFLDDDVVPLDGETDLDEDCDTLAGGAEETVA